MGTTKEKINDMVNTLIGLDEIAGELSPADNARIATQRAELRAKIDELIQIDDVAGDIADL
tara:strand:- start:12694 stop:12876 length:183 start_codon:yes stop_codon:yes gene_type:complete